MKARITRTQQRHRDQRLASWIFGTLLLAFAMTMLLWGPETLPLYKHRVLGILSALLAGLFTYFLLGSVTLASDKVPVKATSGVAVFVLVLWWWTGPSSPIKSAPISPSQIGATVRFSFSRELENGDLEKFDRIIHDDVTLALRFSRVKLLEPPGRWTIPEVDADIRMSIVSLRSSTLANSLARQPTTAGPQVFPIRRFDHFVGALGDFEQSEIWQHSFLQVLLESKTTDANANNHFLDKVRDQSFSQFDEKYGITPALRESWANTDCAVLPMPIQANIEITIDGKPVWRSAGQLARVVEGDEDVRGLVVARFPSSAIGPLLAAPVLP
jgi:hypothetical protein